MAQVDIQAGQWWRTRRGERRYVGVVLPFKLDRPIMVFGEDGDCYAYPVTDNGRYCIERESSEDLVCLLEGCTGWDWTEQTETEILTDAVRAKIAELGELLAAVDALLTKTMVDSDGI